MDKSYRSVFERYIAKVCPSLHQHLTFLDQTPAKISSLDIIWKPMRQRVFAHLAWE